MGFFEQIHGQVGRTVDDARAVALSEEAAALGEEVESALWTVDLEAGDIFGQVDDKVATTLKRLPHFVHATLRRIIGSFSRFLAYRTWAAGVLALQLVASLDYPFGGSDVTDTPAGHGIGFGHTVDDDVRYS